MPFTQAGLDLAAEIFNPKRVTCLASSDHCLMENGVL